MQAQAALISFVGSSSARTRRSRANPLRDRVFPARSSSWRCPGEVGPPAAPAELLPSSALAHVGHRLVREADQMPVIDDDRRVRQVPADRCGERRRRVQRDDLYTGLPLLGLAAQPGVDRPAGAARDQPDQPTSVRGVEVNEAGHPRVGAPPAGLIEDPAHRAGPGLIKAEAADRVRRTDQAESLAQQGFVDCVRKA